MAHPLPTTGTAPAPAHHAHHALIGVGQIRHTRLRPAKHAFAYAGWFLLLPMRSLSLAQRAALPFKERDHGVGGPDALAWVEHLLAQEGVADADGEIWLQTFPHLFGYAFKPVSFWFAHRQDGSLAAIVAEVNNTFGERHCYVLHPPDQRNLRWGQTLSADKVFAVSPFCRTAGQYRFRFLRTPSHMVARIDLMDEDGALLQTSLSGALEPLTRRSLRARFWRQPGFALGVTLRIHWQALRLWLKRVPLHLARSSSTSPPLPPTLPPHRSP
ncbi:DUF1365 domain-containing protein [Leptothrix ochracea]|uniref:DUF1365 domain-containing protein n=1 Tax=Leptothrix ochracea TaxID=735331 RepID=UPI0034E1C839